MEVEEVHAELLGQPGARAVRVTATDEQGQEITLELDLLQLSDVLGDVIECIRCEGDAPFWFYWNPELDVIEFHTKPIG